MVKSVDVTYYGSICKKGYSISYLLMERKILHTFVLSDDFILSLQDIRDVCNYEPICEYLEDYKYIYDLWM